MIYRILCHTFWQKFWDNKAKSTVHKLHCDGGPVVFLFKPFPAFSLAGVWLRHHAWPCLICGDGESFRRRPYGWRCWGRCPGTCGFIVFVWDSFNNTHELIHSMSMCSMFHGLGAGHMWEHASDKLQSWFSCLTLNNLGCLCLALVYNMYL